MNAIKDLLGESGSISSSRVLMFGIALVVLLPPAINAVRNNQPMEINWEMITLVLGSQGWKSVQKFAENGNSEPKPQ